VADLNNISSKPLAGATTAALFLREFVPAKTSWAHLDIAGSFLLESDVRYYRPGATGVMVRTLAALAESLAQCS
jgi:leucyl aminopeptidase